MKTLLIITAYIAPFLFIPAVFRFAGGVLGNLSGMANNRARGVFDRQRKYRGENRAHNRERIKGGKLFRGGVGGVNRRSWLNERAEKLAHIGHAFDQGITAGPSAWKGSVTGAVQTSKKLEQKRIMDSDRFKTYSPFDDFSGPAGDLVIGNKQGIRTNLLKRGIGAEMEDYTDPATGVTGKRVARDENGNLKIRKEKNADGKTGQEELDEHTERIWHKREQGDYTGALRDSMHTTGTFNRKRINADGVEETYEDTEELDRNVSNFGADLRQFGPESLGQALVKAAGAGGTYYDNAADTWKAANLSTSHDGAARAEMAATFRGVLTNAGRGTDGGGSFGNTMGFMSDLGNIEGVAATNLAAKQAAGDTEATLQGEIDAQRTRLQKKFTRHVIENNPASILFHASMKENYVEANLIPVMAELVQEKADRVAGMSKDDAHYEAAYADYMKTLADMDNTYQYALATKPALGRVIGNRLMNLEINDPKLASAATEATEVQEPDPSGLLDASGRPMMRTVTRPAQPARRSTVEAGVIIYKNDPVWQRYHKEWIPPEEYARGRGDVPPAEYQQEAAGARPRPPGPGGGVGGQPGGGMGSPLGG